MKRGLILAGVLFLGACASSSVITSTTYAPTKAEAVRILFAPPTEPYDQVAIISAHGVLGGSFGSNTDIAVNKLKEEAAKVGADAVILHGSPAQSTAVFGNAISKTNSVGTTFATGFATAGGAGDATIEGMAIKFKANHTP